MFVTEENSLQLY